MLPRASLSVLSGVVVGMLAGLAGPARAASPRAELLGLVPEDVGFCLVVSDLRDQAKKLRALPWFKKFQESPLAKSFARALEVQKFRQLEEHLHKRLGVGFAQIRDDILGDAVVLAYRPGPPDKPEQEQGVVLVWARDPKLLARLLEAWNSELKEVQTRTYKDTSYFRRVPARGKSTYYYLNGPLLAFSSREEMIRAVIDRKQGRVPLANAPKTLSIAEQMHRLGADRALVVLWFNPRVFEPHIRKEVEAARGPQVYPFRTFLRYWQALDGAALSLSLDRDIELKLAVRVRPQDVPEAGRRFFTELSQASEVWRYVPPNALLVVAGRIDFVAFAQFVGDFLPPPARDALRNKMGRGLEAGLGLDLFKDVLPNLGPDWGFIMTAPADKDILIPAMTWALKARPGNKPVAVDKALLNGLNSLALWVVFTSSRGDMRLRSVRQGEVEVKYLENDKGFPRGVKPAFALKDGYLLLATSPEGIKEFTRGQAAPAASGEVPLLRVNVPEWVKFLKARQGALVGLIAGKDRVSREQAGRDFEEFLSVLELLDRVELTQRTGSGQATWTLRIRPSGAGEE